MSQIEFPGQGSLDLSETVPNYSQVVSLYQSTDIKVAANNKKMVLAGEVYHNAKEKGVTIPQTLLDDFNKNNGTTLTAKEVLGKEINLTFTQSTENDSKTATWKTTITRVISDDLGESNSHMSVVELDDVIRTNQFIKASPYIILEFKNPDMTKTVVKKLEKNKRYQILSEQAVLEMVITFIRTIQGLLIVLSTQAIVVSMVMIGVIIDINIMQRSREIGVMRAVGYQTKDVKSIFVIEALLITFISLAIAFIGASGIGSLANVIVREFNENIPTVFKLSSVAIVTMVLLAFFMGFVSAYFPTRKISTLDPVEALRYE